MVLQAKKLAHELRVSGWKPGMNIRQNRVFEELSEACGCDAEGHAVIGRKAEMHLGCDSDGYEIKDLFENLVVDRNGDPVGSAFVNEMFDPRHAGSFSEAAVMGAVDSTAFAGVTGQLMVTLILKPYEKEEYILRRMIPTYPSPLKQERWIGTAPPKDAADGDLIVSEGEPLKYRGFGEQYVETPFTKKRMLGIALTKEAIFFNLTGDITQQAASVGDALAFSEERECLGALIGTAVQFTEKRQIDSGRVTLDLYQAAGAGSGAGQLAYAYPTRLYPFVNDVPNNPLDDYTAIEKCDQYFSTTVDPNRGRPIVVGTPFVFAPHSKRINLARVLAAENVWKLTQQGLTSAGAIVTNGPNPLGKIGMSADQVAVSRLLHTELKTRLSLSDAQARNVWFYGNIGEAFRYVTNWPVTVVQAPFNSEAEFEQDIVMRWKASKMGGCAIYEPRVIQRVNFLSEDSGS